jgi:uncharacterized protein HemY
MTTAKNSQNRPMQPLLTAPRRAAEIDRQADYLLSVGRYIQAERLANMAAEMRQAPSL